MQAGLRQARAGSLLQGNMSGCRKRQWPCFCPSAAPCHCRQCLLCQARAPGPLQEAITLGRQENPPPRLLPCSHAPALQPCQLLAQGNFFFQAAALVAQAHLTSWLWHPCQGTRPGTAPGGNSWPLLLVGTTTASSPHSSRSQMGPVRAAGTLLGSCGQQQCWAPKQGR